MNKSIKEHQERAEKHARQSLVPDITSILDEAFNEGVDQSIGLIEGLFAFGTPSKASIIDLLNKLKKP